MTEKPYDIESIGNPEDPEKFEITDTKTDKVYTINANALKGGDYHKIIKASDGTISEDDIRRYHDIVMKLDWQDGWYSTTQMKDEAKTPGYKHIHLVVVILKKLIMRLNKIGYKRFGMK